MVILNFIISIDTFKQYSPSNMKTFSYKFMRHSTNFSVVRSALKFFILFALAYFFHNCAKDDPELQMPTVTSFTPTQGKSGATVTITGTNLTGTTAVSFGGTAATSFSVTNATTVTAVVGSGASGEVKVTTAAGSATLAGFTFLSPPTITSFSPTQAGAGVTVTITGTNLNGTTAVSFGGVQAASFAVVNESTLTAIVGNGATGEVRVSKGSVSAFLNGFVFLGGPTACKLPEQGGRGDIGIGFPRIALRTPSSGTVKVSVVFVDFSDAVASSTPQSVFSSHISPSSENFMSAVSYSKFSLQFVSTYQWFRMSKPSTQYGWTNLTFAAHKTYIQEAISLADPTVDFSGSDAFIIVAPPSATAISFGPAFTALSGNGITVDGKTFYNGATSGADLTAWNGLWFPHELGHTLALVDLYGYSGATHRFVGEFSIMGLISGKGHEMLGWERWLLGWIDDTQVICQSNAGTGVVKLSPIEQVGSGAKLLVIPTGATTAVVVESRRALGFDSQLPKQGPLVYFIDTSIASGNGAIKVLPINDSDVSKLQNTLTLNQTLTYNNVSIKFISTDSAGDEVQFTKN